MIYGDNDETFYYYEDSRRIRDKDTNILDFLKEKSHNKTLENMHISASLNQKKFDMGQEWFNTGHSLEDADEELKNIPSFVYGFNYAKRKKLISKLKEENALYNDGEAWFNDGFLLKDSEKKDNDFFKKGFIDSSFKFGYDYGCKGLSLNELAINYLKNAYFLVGYNKGLQKQKEREERREKYR